LAGNFIKNLYITWVQLNAIKSVVGEQVVKTNHISSYEYSYEWQVMGRGFPMSKHILDPECVFVVWKFKLGTLKVEIKTRPLLCG